MAQDIVSNTLIYLTNRFVTSQQPAMPTLLLRLFYNPLIVVPSTIVASFSEVDAPGYSSVTLDNTLWAFVDGNNLSTASYPPISFSLTGVGANAVTIYGHYVTGGPPFPALPLNWYWGATWSTPLQIPITGITLSVALYFQIENCPTLPAGAVAPLGFEPATEVKFSLPQKS
jgi:hypothetical protein